MTMENRYIGSVKLFATSDALGWITERVKSKGDLKKKCGVEIIDKFYDWKTGRGRFGDSIGTIEAGSYSDDTQLMLAVARSIKPDGNIDYHYFAKRELASWYKYNRGAGNTVSNAAIKISRKSVNWNTNFFTYNKNGKTRDYRDCGANGAAMRILPIVLANRGNFKKIKENIFGNAIITHGHPRAILGAILYGYALDSIFKHTPQSINGLKFLEGMSKVLDNVFNLTFVGKPEFVEWIRIWNDNSQARNFLSEYNDELFATKKKVKDLADYLKHGYSLKEVYSKLDCFTKGKISYGTNTVLAGIYTFCKYLDDPENGTIEAVNTLGSDTDTIAGFVGGLFGALYGDDIIPEKWKDVQDSDYLDEVAKKLYEISSGNQSQIKSVAAIKGKDISTIIDDQFSIGDTVYLALLGNGKVISKVLRPSHHKGKEKLYLGVRFDIGQSCIFSKLIPE